MGPYLHVNFENVVKVISFCIQCSYIDLTCSTICIRGKNDQKTDQNFLFACCFTG
jgi:hypothetical protein